MPKIIVSNEKKKKYIHSTISFSKLNSYTPTNTHTSLYISQGYIYLKIYRLKAEWWIKGVRTITKKQPRLIVFHTLRSMINSVSYT